MQKNTYCTEDTGALKLISIILFSIFFPQSFFWTNSLSIWVGWKSRHTQAKKLAGFPLCAQFTKVDFCLTQISPVETLWHTLALVYKRCHYKMRSHNTFCKKKCFSTTAWTPHEQKLHADAVRQSLRFACQLYQTPLCGYVCVSCIYPIPFPPWLLMLFYTCPFTCRSNFTDAAEVPLWNPMNKT